MKTLVIFVFAVMILASAGCGNKEESAEKSAEQPQSVSKTTVDLHTAVVLNRLDVIQNHIDAGDDLNALEPSRASTPLITAAALGRTDAAKLLIDAGADLDYRNNDGSTALITAAFFCHPEIVQALLDKGADKMVTNNMGRTALESVEIPFEDVKDYYDAVGTALRPAGVVLDYDYIKATRPKIAEMLR